MGWSNRYFEENNILNKLSLVCKPGRRANGRIAPLALRPGLRLLFDLSV